MIRVYGIKNCDSVRKAVKYLKSKEIDFAFNDFRETPVSESEIRSWINAGTTTDQLFNTRGTTYRTLKLKELDLDSEDKIKWLAKENTLIKRPVVVLDEETVFVGYDESLYQKNLD
ncbi:MAG: arsenate reductase family protein [Campylobacterota bacterium]|nr:arsenate reductase family protein [Campylobacterota bacterium]